jgi:hypothetical protein
MKVVASAKPIQIITISINETDAHNLSHRLSIQADANKFHIWPMLMTKNDANAVPVVRNKSY